MPYTILERDEIMATLVTFEQRGQGHVPVGHTIADLSAHEQWAVMAGVVRATKAIELAFDPAGIAVWQNNGIPAHQTVPHVHVHVAGTLPGAGAAWGSVARLPTERTEQIAPQLLPHLPCRAAAVSVQVPSAPQ